MSKQSREFEQAVRGWRQCLTLLSACTKSLEFALEVIEFSEQSEQLENEENAKRFVEAQADLRFAQKYLEVMRRKGVR
jgi:hypothetical protein